jgi:hypothetical protein
MSDDLARQLRERMELEKARRLAEAEAAIARDLESDFERDMAEIARLSDKYKFIVNIPGVAAADVIYAPGISNEAFNGTFADLVRRYQQDERSPYHKLKHSVRLNYDSSFRRMGIGDERVADWNADTVQNRYDNLWAAGDKVATGHDMVTKLRLLLTFGSVVLNDNACIRLSAILGNMRFPVSKGTSERLTREQARAIRIAAREHFGWDSIALAQALQFEFPKLRQSDVIGEWVPLSEPGTSDVVRGNQKWVRGLRWSDLDENLMLRPVLTSGRKDEQKQVAFNLKRAGMAMEEINRVHPSRRIGPMIICEFSGLPWSGNEYRRKWRKVADTVGLPKTVKNSDSREKPVADEESELGADTAL